MRDLKKIPNPPVRNPRPTVPALVATTITLLSAVPPALGVALVVVQVLP